MSRPGFSFLVCPDAEMIRGRISALLAEHSCEGSDRRVYWGDEELPKSFWQDLTVPSLMGGTRAVILRRAGALPADIWHALASPLRGFNASVWPFFCLEGEWDKGQPKIPKWIAKQPYYAVASKKGWIWQSPGLTPDTLARHVKAWAQRRGLTFEPRALQAFLSVLPRDARAVALELDKVELGLAGRSTVTDDALSLVSFHSETSIFDLLRILSGKGPAHSVWRKVLDSELGGEGMVFPFLGLLVREARTLWGLLHGEQVYVPPYARADKEALARRLGAAGLTRVWELAIEAEFGVKSGRMSPDQALEILMAGLFGLFQTTSRDK